jgi:threonine dehydrogenase-like Zn-dependent dehydrogenase
VCGYDARVFGNGHQKVKPPVISGHELCGETLENVNTYNGKIIQSSTRVAVLPIISCLIANTAIINNTTYVLI